MLSYNYRRITMIDNFKKYFNQNVIIKPKQLKKYQKAFWWAVHITKPSNTSWDEMPNSHKNQLFKNTLGYQSAGTSGILSNLQSENASRGKEAIVKDHIYGATEIGKLVFKKILKGDFDTKAKADKWLKNNLHLWGIIKITFTEHKSNNVVRVSQYTISQKNRFEHYINVSPLISTKK